MNELQKALTALDAKLVALYGVEHVHDFQKEYDVVWDLVMKQEAMEDVEKPAAAANLVGLGAVATK